MEGHTVENHSRELLNQNMADAPPPNSNEREAEIYANSIDKIIRDVVEKPAKDMDKWYNDHKEINEMVRKSEE